MRVSNVGNTAALLTARRTTAEKRPLPTATLETGFHYQMRNSSLLIRLGFLGVASAWPALTGAQVARADTLHGRVVDRRNDPLSNADVIATRGPDRKVFRSHTNQDGQWTIVVDSGTGDYLVYVSAPGRTAVRRRVTRSAQETDFSVNVLLVEASAALLAPIEIRGTRREQVEREADGFGPPQGGAESSNFGVLGSSSPGAQGDLAALVGSVPGVRATRDGVSGLGLPGNQNLVTLNGLAFGLGELPRGAIGTARVMTTAWDIARGGFSGLQVDANVPPGSEFLSRRLYVSADAPSFQATDAAGRALGLTFRRLDVNLFANGALTGTDRFVYATAARVRTQKSDVPSLLSSLPAAFDAVGLPNNAAIDVASAAQAQGIPLGVSHGTSRTDVQFVGRLDRLNYDADTYATVPRSYGVMAVLNFRADRGDGLGPTVMPSVAESRREMSGALQIVHSLMVHHWLHESSASLSLRDMKSTPLSRLPTGTIRFDSVVDYGALIGVTLGGGASSSGTERQTRLEATQTSQTYLGPGTRQLLKLFGQVRLDGAADDIVTNGLGTYEYASLSDFSAMRPSAFSRTLALPIRRGTSWNGALGAGIIFRPSALFSLQYGLRVERSAFVTKPDANPELSRTLGVATDVAPAEFSVSPRLGFRWVYSRRPRDCGYQISTPYGTQATDVRGVLRGGIGEFRNYLDPHDAAIAAAYTGIGAAQQHLRCIGDAVPARTWRSFVTSPGSVPRACDGETPFLADTAPDVRALAPAYRSPRSWRANLNWSTRALRTDIAVESILSLNLSQPSSSDANFNGLARTTVARESHRPLFVSESSVVPASGVVSAVESRRSGAFGGVIVDGSNGRSTSEQLRVTLTPPAFLFRHFANARVSWILSRSRSRVNGFDGTTAGDPREAAWAPGNGDVRHQIVLEGAIDFGKDVGLTIFLNANSGLPYTPIVRGDINGDGRTDNDRAFVTRGGSDTATVAGMNRLLGDQGALRSRCLMRSLESIATVNSCRGSLASASQHAARASRSLDSHRAQPEVECVPR